MLTAKEAANQKVSIGNINNNEMLEEVKWHGD